MPCYDPRDHGDGITRLSERCAELTDLLCKAGRAYTNQTPVPKEVIKYWLEHRAMDKKHGDPW